MDKESIRQQVWDMLDDEGIARFPFPPHNRIPNFDGADAAASRLTSLSWWEAVDVLKCNPDAPQRPVREQALVAGKTVLMAKPRLKSSRPFIVIDPDTIDEPTDAATIGGADEHGVAVGLDEVPPVDAIISGSVAVDRRGRRIGKGEGYSDLEFAILLETGAIDRSVSVATTVHDRQVFDERLPSEPHDVSLDHTATPTTVHHVTDRPNRPTGLVESLIDDGRQSEIPALVDVLERNK